MAEEGEYVRRSVKDLAAGLNMGEVGRVPITSVPAKPTIKPKVLRSNTTSLPVGNTDTAGDVGNQPARRDSERLPVPGLPPRRPTDKATPSTNSPALPQRRGTEVEPAKPPVPGLPPRRPTNQPPLPTRTPSQASVVSSLSAADNAPTPGLPPRRPTETPKLPGRRTSQSSIASTASAISSKSGLTNGRSTSSRTTSFGESRIKAPEYDPSKLPPLPPKRSEQNKDDDVPPQLPVRGKSSNSSGPPLPSRSEGASPAQPPRRLPPRDVPALPSRSPRPNGDASANGADSAPPPVPLGSRPDLSKLMATKPKYDPSAQTAARPASSSSSSSSTNNCMICRDFSGPDNHATKFPRHTVSSIDRLAYDLTSPFSTLTDKARAIFAWMHHNVAYDCAAFFGNRVRGQTPMDTLKTGAAVCQGYADLYAAIAVKAGLECVVVGGHGKGYGYKPIKPGDPVPPENPTGHAWNAVKIDIGGPYGYGQPYWKLLDACWGAGNVGDDQQYQKSYKPHEFADSNEDFGRRHFPSDKKQFFRADGRALTWAEYIVGDNNGDPVFVYGNVAPREGISQTTFLPKQKHITLDPAAHAATGGMIRFQFQRVCEHWVPEVNGAGKDFPYALACGNGDWEPFQTNGMYWWCDVHVSRLGKSGDKLNVWVIDTINGETGRGITPEGYKAKIGRAAMGFSGLAHWELV